MSNIVFSQGLYELMDSYDGFIIDQWGVLHNGIKPYDGVIDALEHLKEKNKQVIILSNSAKRADYNISRMKKLGLKPSLYDQVVTSGEVTWTGLKEQKMPPFENIGKKCYLISRSGDKELLEGLDIELVSNIEDAQFILITSIDSKSCSIEDMDKDLKKAVSKRIPAICANPDVVTVFGHERMPGPGAIAQRYQELGGAAHYIGKPHKTIFRHSVSLFKKVIPSKILVIGDSIQHDIAGGMGVDIDTAFIEGGIHSSSFKKGMTPDQKRKTMEHIIQSYGGIRPTLVMETLIWQTPEAALHERERARSKN